MRRSYPTVALTGHRPEQLSSTQAAYVKACLEDLAYRLIDRHDMTEGITGMARGCDTWWAKALVKSGVDLAAYVPFPQQCDQWSTAEQSTHAALLGEAARVKVLGTTPATWLYHARNEAMIADADALIAVWLPSVRTGGTYSTMQKAASAGRPIMHVDPSSQSMTWMRPEQH